MSDKTCDNASVGVIAEYSRAPGRGRWLFIWRATFPLNVAPVAGHVFDDHKGYPDAARAEMLEEAGLTVESLSLTPAGGWRPNKCRRKPGKLGTGHQWEVYTATVSGELSPSAREARQARWLSMPEIQLLANRTLLYAMGRIEEEDYAAEPGIEPVWVGFLAELDLVHMRTADLELVAQLMAGGGVRA